MAKRIYVGRDLAEASRATGIALDTLKRAEAGQVELSRAEQDKLQAWLKKPQSPRDR